MRVLFTSVIILFGISNLSYAETMKRVILLSLFEDNCFLSAQYNQFQNSKQKEYDTNWFKFIEEKSKVCEEILTDNWPNENYNLAEFNQSFELMGGFEYLAGKPVYQNYRNSYSQKIPNSIAPDVLFKPYKINFFGFSDRFESRPHFDKNNLDTSAIHTYRALFRLCSSYIGDDYKISGFTYSQLETALTEIQAKESFLNSFTPFPKFQDIRLNFSKLKDFLSSDGLIDACLFTGKYVAEDVNKKVEVLKQKINSTNKFEHYCHSFRSSLSSEMRRIEKRIVSQHKIYSKFSINKLNYSLGNKRYTQKPSRFDVICKNIFQSNLNEKYTALMRIRNKTSTQKIEKKNNEQEIIKNNQLIK